MIQLSYRGCRAVVLAAVVLLAGCASGPDTGDTRTIATLHLQNAAAREMEARGYVRSDMPDLVINFHGRIDERVDIQSRPAPSMGPTWGYRGWAGSPWGGWGGTEVTTRRYNVGTLVVDVVDFQRRQMVFQGVAEGTMTRDMQNNREQAINQAMGQIFARFPFVAGQSAPVRAQ
jgi:hypothetical protein